jgi:hypothetical protein
MSSLLPELIAELRERVDVEGCWHLSTEDLSDIARIDYRDLYRLIFAERDRINLSDAIDGFGEDSVGDFVTVCEKLEAFGERTETVLFEAGFFIPWERGAELLAASNELMTQSAANHTLDQASFEGMLRHTKSVDRAIRLYLDEYFPFDPVLDTSADRFVRAHRLPEPGYQTARRYLEMLAQRHFIRRRNALVGVVRALYGEAERLGYLDSRAGEGEREKDRRTVEGDRRSWALEVLGLPDRSADPETLRGRYRALVRKFHPDVNPRGLEECKRVNEAYAILATGGPFTE